MKSFIDYLIENSYVKEEAEHVEEGIARFIVKAINKVTAANKSPLPQKSDRRQFQKPSEK